MRPSREVQVIGLMCVLIGLPMWFLLWCAGSLQDKPYGWHVTPFSYLMVGLVAVAGAALSWGLAWLATRRGQPGWVRWAVAALIGLGILFTFCRWWNPWIQEYRDLYGRPTEPPAYER